MTTPQAQKKREQRARREAGVTIVQLGVRLEGWAEILVPHGCLAESHMEDRAATVAALELFLEQVRTGNRTVAIILRDRQTVLPEPKERQTYKPKKQDRPADPDLGWAFKPARKTRPSDEDIETGLELLRQRRELAASLQKKKDDALRTRVASNLKLTSAKKRPAWKKMGDSEILKRGGK